MFSWYMLRLRLTGRMACEPKEGYGIANMNVSHENLYLPVNLLKYRARNKLIGMLDCSCWILCHEFLICGQTTQFSKKQDSDFLKEKLEVMEDLNFTRLFHVFLVGILCWVNLVWFPNVKYFQQIELEFTTSLGGTGILYHENKLWNFTLFSCPWSLIHSFFYSIISPFISLLLSF